MNNVYVIKRMPTAGCMTCISSNDHRPCLVAFSRKKDAKQFKRMIHDMQDNTRPHQKIEIESVPCQQLIRMCALTSLDISLHKAKGKTKLIRPCTDTEEMRLWLETSF
eukprot:gene19537-26218_t